MVEDEGSDEPQGYTSNPIGPHLSLASGLPIPPMAEDEGSDDEPQGVGLIAGAFADLLERGYAFSQSGTSSVYASTRAPSMLPDDCKSYGTSIPASELQRWKNYYDIDQPSQPASEHPAPYVMQMPVQMVAESKSEVYRYPPWYFLLAVVFLCLSLSSKLFDQTDSRSKHIEGVALLSVVCLIPAMINRILAKSQILFNALIMLAIFGSMFRGQFFEAGSVMILFYLAQWMNSKCLSQSTEVLTQIIANRPKTAFLPADFQIPIEKVTVGQKIIVPPGQRVPLDGIITKGETTLNCSLLNPHFELMSEPKKLDDKVWAGGQNLGTVIEMTTTSSASDSSFARMAEFLSTAQSKHSELDLKFKFMASAYSYMMLLTAVVMVALPYFTPYFTLDQGIHYGISLLIAACACAVMNLVETTTSLVLAQAARRNTMIKSGVLEKLSTVNIDKTSTVSDLFEGYANAQISVQTGAVPGNADVVLLDVNINKLVYAKELGSRTMSTIWINLSIAVIVKIVTIVCIFTMEWPVHYIMALEVLVVVVTMCNQILLVHQCRNLALANFPSDLESQDMPNNNVHGLPQRSDSRRSSRSRRRRASQGPRGLNRNSTRADLGLPLRPRLLSPIASDTLTSTSGVSAGTGRVESDFSQSIYIKV